MGTMRQYATQIFFAFTVFCVLADTVSVHAQSQHEAREHLFIFVDRSASALQDERAQATYRETALKHVLETLKGRGNRVTLAPLNEKTLSLAEAVTYVNDTPEYDEPEHRTDRARAKRAHLEQMKRAIARGVRGANQWLEETEQGGEFDGWTDIWGVLGILSEKATSPDVQYRAVLLTDMFESMARAGRRDFDARPPASRAQAEQWAKVDVQKMPDYMVLDTSALGRTSFQVERGYLAAKDGAQNVKFYWRMLFEELQVSRVQW